LEVVVQQADHHDRVHHHVQHVSQERHKERTRRPRPPRRALLRQPLPVLAREVGDEEGPERGQRDDRAAADAGEDLGPAAAWPDWEGGVSQRSGGPEGRRGAPQVACMAA
jgi:hypothetical protein